MDSNVPFEETILSYLKGQELWPEDDFEVKPDDNAEENIQELIRELLEKVNKRIACRDRYDNLRKHHNQYPLFDLSDYFPEFCIDEELMQKLSFRETLLISELDPAAAASSASQADKPVAVGGLCLYVEAIDAYAPDELKRNADDVEMDREIFQIYRRAKQAFVAQKLEDYASDYDDRMDENLRRTLTDYESFLRNEAKANVKKFAVHVSSQFSVDGGKGANAGSRITAWVDRNFHTLEEKRKEYFTDRDGRFWKKCLYLALQTNRYYLKTSSTSPEVEERKYYGLGKTHDLVGEGASFILMRYLAVTKFTGRLELSATYINGDMCRNIYECTGPRMGEVNEKNMEVCKIYRYVIEQCGIEHHCVTVLTVHGQIISQEWEGCNFILHLNPLQFVHDDKPCPYDKLVLEKTWIQDMELLSKYLDCKTVAELKMKTYISDHPEMRDILTDYLNNILLLKPENIFTFTMDFFESLCPIKIARMGYIENDNPNTEYY